MAFGITSFFKKKVSEEKIADLFVNIIFNAVDNSFSEVAELLNNDINLVTHAEVDAENQDDFLMIVITGNFKLLGKYFNDGQDDRIRELTIGRLAGIYEIEPEAMRSAISQMSAFFKKINFPSKNIHHAMSRAVFYKYGLNPFQTEYFKNLNVPDPILLKNIDEIMDQFIIKWGSLKEKYRVKD